MNPAVHAVADRIGRRAWGSAIGLTFVTVGAIFGDELRLATMAAFAMVFACGVTAGAHLVGRRF